ncbi:MAG: hypothetical protein VB133_09115 [Anaeromusa sp.]|uniref:hypothetical protein n=1 Tax=Anaeromusa sp. TaxID=1872520 RepID=UPI002B1FAD87|nr:hypothetical protein [Anaeromusa sp.]MEA4835282.1 hypothetical protein [Anaeromusa sp.]
MTEFDLNEARINYIPPIRILNKSDEDKLTMTSIYFEAMRKKEWKEMQEKFERYKISHPIFVKNKKIFKQVRDGELISYNKFIHVFDSIYVKYESNYFKTDYMKSSLLAYVDKISKNYITYIRIHPYFVTQNKPPRSLQEQLIQPLKFDWIKQLTLYKNEKTGGYYSIQDIRLESRHHTEEEKLNYWEFSVYKLRSLDVSAERTNEGNLRMMIEELTECTEVGYYRTKMIHLDTDNIVGTSYEEAILNHIDLAINMYDEDAYKIRKQERLKNGIVQDATMRIHLVRLEKVPFRMLFDLAELFFDSKILMRDWFADLKLPLMDKF